VALTAGRRRGILDTHPRQRWAALGVRFNDHRVCFAFVSRWARWLHVARTRARGVKPACEVGVQARDVPSLSDREGDSGPGLASNEMR
jgi:hypothetical protein